MTATYTTPIQAALDFSARPRYVRTSETSRAAQASAQPKAGTKRALVLAFIRGRGADGATDEEIQRDLPMGPNTERPRRVELVDAGLIRDSGRRRETLGGAMAVVWVAA